MLNATENIGDIPVRGMRLVGRRCAALHILCGRLLAGAASAGTDQGAGDGADPGGHILSAAATDLVAEHATDQGANQCAWDIGRAALLHRLFTLNPATL